MRSFARLSAVIDRLERGWLPDSPQLDGLYAWEPLPLHQFLEGLDVASVVPPGRFLDVGCGIGTKLLIASQYGYEVSGLELRPEYLEAARRLVPEARLIQGDAMEFEGYGEFDFLYCYRPFVDDEQEDELERRMLVQLKVGAWIYLPHRSWLPIEARGDLHMMGTPIWRKAW